MSPERKTAEPWSWRRTGRMMWGVVEVFLLVALVILGYGTLRLLASWVGGW